MTERLCAAIVAAISRLELNLDGRQVITEAATGTYVVTPVIAAAAGANVVALTKAGRYGTVEQVQQQTQTLAAELDLAGQIRIVESLDPRDVAAADVLTNSGHLRPIRADVIGHMRRGAVIPLMYDRWELRHSDVDLDACRSHGVLVAGTDEAHPDVDVLKELGIVVTRSLTDAGCEIRGRDCLLISDNPMGPAVARQLELAGAHLTVVSHPQDAARDNASSWQIVVIAVTPPAAGGRLLDLDAVSAEWYCQLWGDVARRPAHKVWLPGNPVQAGHMGLSLTVAGPEPIVRLQAAGLKTAQQMLSGSQSPAEQELVQWVISPTDRSCP